MSKDNVRVIPEIDWKRTDLLISLALEEDLDERGDTTTLAVVPEKAQSRAVLRCKQRESGLISSGREIRGFRIVTRTPGSPPVSSRYQPLLVVRRGRWHSFPDEAGELTLISS